MTDNGRGKRGREARRSGHLRIIPQEAEAAAVARDIESYADTAPPDPAVADQAPAPTLPATPGDPDRALRTVGPAPTGDELPAADPTFAPSASPVAGASSSGAADAPRKDLLSLPLPMMAPGIGRDRAANETARASTSERAADQPTGTSAPAGSGASAGPDTPDADVTSKLAPSIPPEAHKADVQRPPQEQPTPVIQISSDRQPVPGPGGGRAAGRPYQWVRRLPRPRRPRPAKAPREGDDATAKARRPAPVIKIATGVVFGIVAILIVRFGGSAGLAALALIIITWVSVEYYLAIHPLSRRARIAPESAAEAVAPPPTSVATALRDPALLVGVTSTLAMGLAAYLVRRDPFSAVGLVAVAGLIASAVVHLGRAPKGSPPAAAAAGVTGIVHVGVMGCFALLILRLQHGFAILLVVVVLVIVDDVAAYAWGSLIGRHPMAPSVSPNKTIEGFLGAAATTFVTAALIVLARSYTWPSFGGVAIGHYFARNTFIIAAVVIVFGALGDLAESLMKRSIGVKDMASLLPGHGGMFDRFDAMVFALPSTYAALLLIGVRMV